MAMTARRALAAHRVRAAPRAPDPSLAPSPRSNGNRSDISFPRSCCARGRMDPPSPSAGAAALEEAAADGRPARGSRSARPPARAHAHRRRSGRRRALHAARRAAHAPRSRACLALSPCQADPASRGTRRRHTRAGGRTCRSSGRRTRLEVEGTLGSIVSPRTSSVCYRLPPPHRAWMLMPSGGRRNPTRRAIARRGQGSQRQHSAQATKSCARRADSGAGDPPSINFSTYRGRTWLPGWQPLA